jgi:competence protein ComGD
MKRVLQDERGFTLIEMLVVLTIVLVISCCALFYSHEKILRKLDYQLMNYTELLIRMTQMQSIEDQYPYMLLPSANRSKIIIRKSNDLDNDFFVYELPKGHRFELNTSTGYLYFKASGNLKAFGSYKYTIGNEQHRFTLNIGKGRILKGQVIYE